MAEYSLCFVSMQGLLSCQLICRLDSGCGYFFNGVLGAQRPRYPRYPRLFAVTLSDRIVYYLASG